jgi:hypothetical protein
MEMCMGMAESVTMVSVVRPSGDLLSTKVADQPPRRPEEASHPS